MTTVGAHVFSSVAELVKASDIIILSLADTPAVESIVTDNILDYGSADKLLIDLSSIHPKVTRYLASALADSCCMGWVDAPVSGGVAGAEKGSLEPGQ